MSILNEVDIEFVKKIAIEAGKEILKYYKTDLNIEYKEDDSPVTIADKKANAIICEALKKAYAHIPILSEESDIDSYEIRKQWEYYWCIDPLDGTRGFINQTDEFTVNIALIEGIQPVLGVVFAPCSHKLYYAQDKQGAFLELLDAAFLPKESFALPMLSPNLKHFKVVTSSSRSNALIQQYIEKLKDEYATVSVHKVGSSLKLCMVAQGVYDSCPLFYTTMQWDTAAAHIILLCAGKEVLDMRTETTYVYDKHELKNSFLLCK